ncbi:MAG: flagellin FliC [Proteobacteria bacterium]|jgi:flagellin|nr:flagellin FliC [Pseudomonadota bacterium]NBX47015.1 flagellin FliC [Chloroflexota bacterium]NBQ31583.1 flagellin FliC [Pseudomonadota bacterium]NBQ62024.1 flagellin FliC [Pseudomonadota bacterium]NBT03629.1 flagellin FliC [Pseudomonadota bacterium]
MALRINYNLASSSAQRGLASSQDAYAKQAQRLSTGLRINSASDDAAGMAVSEKLKNQVRGLNQAQRNAQDGVSLIQTAEGALTETHSILARMRELAVQSSNDTLTASDRANANAEFTQLQAEVTRIGNATQFNGTSLLNGSTASITLQIGANNGDTLAVALTNNTAATLAVDTNNITTQATASAAITALDAAINTVSTNRSNLGAMQNRLDSVTRSLAVASENTAAANSRIADADIASSMSELVRSQILQQAGVSVLAQANQAPSMVLQLLK